MARDNRSDAVMTIKNEEAIRSNNAHVTERRCISSSSVSGTSNVVVGLTGEDGPKSTSLIE